MGAWVGPLIRRGWVESNVRCKVINCEDFYSLYCFLLFTWLFTDFLMFTLPSARSFPFSWSINTSHKVIFCIYTKVAGGMMET
jgi:hypothetical protein